MESEGEAFRLEVPHDERAEDEDNGPAASGIRVHRYDHYDDFFDYEDAEDYSEELSSSNASASGNTIILYSGRYDPLRT